MRDTFISGWHPDLGVAAAEKLESEGRPLFAADYRDTRPLPTGFSLSRFRRWPYDQGPVGSCARPGTKIRMADKTEKNIEDVKLFDVVQTAEGRTGIVSALMGRRHVGSILTVQIDGHPGLTLTAEHPILTSRGYVQTGDILSSADVAQTLAEPKDRPASTASLFYPWDKVNHEYLTVLGVTRSPYDGPVYNLQVEGDNSYVADGIGVHNCFANAPTQAFQIATAADNAAGANWEEYQLSRAMVWYEGRLRDGSIGSGGDGGSVTNAFLSMSDKGLAREELWPYKPNHNWLERKPPDTVIQDANHNHVTAVASVAYGEAVRRSIFNLDPVGIGIWWPYGWDSAVDSTGRITGIGSGVFGHALAIIGWIDDWDGHRWYQIENSHGPIYHPIPQDIASKIPGYVGYVPNNPNKVHDFWAREDWLGEVMNKGQSEIVAAGGVNAFQAKSLPWGRTL